MKYIKEKIDGGGAVLRNEEGRAVIKMTVRDDTSFLSPYSGNDVPMISSDVADFIKESAVSFKPKEKFVLDIYGECIDEEEKIIYTAAIKNYFSAQNVSGARDLKRNMRIAFVMFLSGLLALSCMFVFENHGVGELWIECIDILAWVFLWETADLLFISRNAMKVKQTRLNSLIEMPIRFYS